MIKLRKQIFGDELRNLCVRKDWFTCGSIADYDAMFNKLNNDMSDEEIVDVCKDIFDYSEVEKKAEEYGVPYEEVFDTIIYEVFEIVHTFVVR